MQRDLDIGAAVLSLMKGLGSLVGLGASAMEICREHTGHRYRASGWCRYRAHLP